MFASARTCVGELIWADGGKGTAKSTFRFPFPISLANAYSALDTIATAMQGISDAALVGVTIRYAYYQEAPIVPGIQSDVGYYLCLYYSNGVDKEPLFVPSPRESLLETEGDFAGIRLDLANPQVVQLASALTDALSTTLDPAGGNWERELLVGGRTR